MNKNDIRLEIVKWKDKDFLEKVQKDLSNYVKMLDKILFARYYKMASQIDKSYEPIPKKWGKYNFVDKNFKLNTKDDFVSFDTNINVANGGYISGKIIVNPNSAMQFYKAYEDFVDGKKDGIRDLDFAKPLKELEDLSSLEILYWYFYNDRTYEDFLKNTMLHENIHRWTLDANLFDDPIDVFVTEGRVELEARRVADENNLDYAKCFRNDEVALINYLQKYGDVDKEGGLLLFSSTYYLLSFIAYKVFHEIPRISNVQANKIAKSIYLEVSNKFKIDKANTGRNYREIFSEIRENKSPFLVDFIEKRTLEERSKFLHNREK